MKKQSKELLDFSDLTDFQQALRGQVAQLNPPIIKAQDGSGRSVWDLTAYDFIPTINKPSDYQSIPPQSINRSLWRLAQLNKIHGLFEVCKGVYQVRGYDLANMTLVETDTGVDVIDCLNCIETAQAAFELYLRHKDKKVPVVGIIVTHSHVDHYGGMAGILAYGEDVPIYAPDGFMEAVVLENAFVGDAMARRSTFMYGTLLPKEELGQIDAGLGKAVANGTVGLVAPTYSVTDDVTQIDIDGVSFEFMLFPETEAPAEMTIYIPKHKLLIPAELSTQTLHNVLTPRGASVRDVRAWAKALDTLLMTYEDQLDIICSVHHWPTWGKDACCLLLEAQRDAYKFLHDQTVRLMNQGYTMLELAAEFDKPGFLPDFMLKEWYNRGYYGTVSYNVRAIYQKYLGWYDMNPSNLNPLPPVAVAKRYVKALGGENRVTRLVEHAYECGDHQWAAELGKHLVFNNPSRENCTLLARIYDILGQKNEAATWRNMYLTGSSELRKGGPLRLMDKSVVNIGTLEVMDSELLYDFIAGRFIAPKARDVKFKFDIYQTDKGEKHHIESLGRGVLNVRVQNEKKTMDAYPLLELNRQTFARLILKTDGYTLKQAIYEKKVQIIDTEGRINQIREIQLISQLFDLIETVIANFNIVQP